MKAGIAAILAFTLAAAGTANVVQEAPVVNKLNPILGLLKDMLTKSTQDGKADDEAYAKYKCYCDQNLKEKADDVKTVQEQVDMIDSDVQRLSGTAGGLSTEMQQINQAKTEITTTKAEAVNLREQEHKEYSETIPELDQAISAMNDAIDILSSVGNDASVGLVAKGKKIQKAPFLAPSNSALASFKKNVKQALLAASAFLKPKDRVLISNFLQQDPRKDFRGAYETQSGGILGVLQNMKENFMNEKATAEENEQKAAEQHSAFIATKDDSFAALEDSLGQKESLLSTTDNELAAKKSQFELAKVTLDDNKNFLANLEPMCAEKAKEYDYRRSFRVGEEAVVAKAISILSSENAIKKFQRLPSDLALVDRHARHSFVQMADAEERDDSIVKTVALSLKEKSNKLKSSKLAQVAAFMSSAKFMNPFRQGYEHTNPYDIIFAEMDKMVKIMDQEAAVDSQQLDWCQHERAKNNAAITEKNTEVSGINTTVLNLVAVLDDAESGLKAQLSTVEEAITQVREEQTQETSIRQGEYAAFKAKARDIEEELPVLQSAINTLKNYFQGSAPSLNSTGLVQSHMKGKQEPPATWESADLQANSQSGNVIGLLEQVYSETAAELQQAQRDEETAQTQYDTSLKALKRTEAEKMVVLANLQMDKAVKDEELEQARESLHSSEKDVMALEQYLESIKPGCDFINANFEMRKQNRATEKTALATAKEQIMAAPAYQAALEAQRLGKCKDICVATSGAAFEHVNCQACLNDVTVVGWCVSHPFTTGCMANSTSTQ